MTPQEVQDEKDRRKAEKAYNAAMTNTPANPKKPVEKKAMGGAVKKYARGGAAGGDEYTRGKSGFSKADEKAAKEYGQLDYKATKGSPLPESERKYRRDTGAPLTYLGNTKTEKGREVNRKNVVFTRNEGVTEKYAKGGMVRGDGCAQRGKTKGRMI